MTAPPEPVGTIDAGLLNGLHNVIHSWVPHSSALVDGLSIVTGLIVFAAVAVHGTWRKREKATERAFRVGFASTPIPVFLILPLVPYDHDLAEMLLDERLLLALAAGTGLVWTVREVWKAFLE